MARIAGLFPGQGSQTVGMGALFFENSELARTLLEQADRSLNLPLSELMLKGPLEKLTLTENAQPAILVLSYISWRLAELELTAAAGHSLGEYSALLSAGCFDFTDAVQLVHKRGRYMQEAVPAGQGKMAAVMGPAPEEIQAVIEQGDGVVEIANLNCPGQTVVAGEAAALDAFCARMSAAGGKIIPLNVSAPFHCSLMRPAAERLAADLDAITIRDPRFPVYANAVAAPVSTAAEVRDALKKQVCGSVRWTESMLRMIEEQSITHAVEFGAGGVLTKLLKRISPAVSRLEAADPVTLEKTKSALA